MVMILIQLIDLSILNTTMFNNFFLKHTKGYRNYLEVCKQYKTLTVTYPKSDPLRFKLKSYSSKGQRDHFHLYYYSNDWIMVYEGAGLLDDDDVDYLAYDIVPFSASCDIHVNDDKVVDAVLGNVNYKFLKSQKIDDLINYYRSLILNYEATNNIKDSLIRREQDEIYF